MHPELGTVRAAPSRTAGCVEVLSRSASVSTARPARAGMRRMAAWKVAWRAASVLGLERILGQPGAT